MVETTTGNKKAERFVRVAGKRTQRVLDSLRLLGQCSNRRSYEYTDAQVNRIFREIRKSLREAEHDFKRSKSERNFRL